MISLLIFIAAVASVSLIAVLITMGMLVKFLDALTETMEHLADRQVASANAWADLNRQVDRLNAQLNSVFNFPEVQN